MNKYKEYLVLCGLNDNDIEELDRIFNKLEIPKADIEELETEYHQGIPFEGGISFTEGLILSKIALKNE